jgi:hypothetical protein
VYLHGEEPDAVMQNLLEVAENTCYLHAALRSAIPSRVVATLSNIVKSEHDTAETVIQNLK